MKFLFLGGILFGFVLSGVMTASAAKMEYKLYREVITAVQKKDYTRYNKLKNRLKNYVLYPYVEYQLLNANLSLARKNDVRGFINKYRETPIGEYLLRKWLDYLMKKGRYDLAASYSAPKHEITSNCHILSAGIKKGIDVQYLPNRYLWLYGDLRPDACKPVFSYWKKKGYIGPKAYGQRVRLSLAKGNLDFAETLASNTGSDIKKLVKLHQRKKRLITRAKGYGSGVYKALTGLPQAVQDNEVRAWKARQLLQVQNWSSLVREIENMPPPQKETPQWSYWLARAYDHTGRRDKARKLYRKAAKTTTFYGFLSADRLGRPYSICPQTDTINADVLYKKYPGLRRAFELRKAGSSYFAGREWNAVIDKMGSNRNEITGAARLAADNNWHFRAILELGKIKEYRNYDIRFPLILEKDVKKYAARHNLLPQFVYGIMRTESAMRANAVSHAGARGIMQVMPATARRVAKKFNLPKPGTADLLNPQYNISLGSGYLDMMGDKWNKQLILMIASYNAGPHNVKKWLKKLPKTADVFIATIPFDETRKYVTRVLDYTTLYAWRLGYNVRRVGGMISNIGSNKGFIRRKNSRTKVVCDAGA